MYRRVSSQKELDNLTVDELNNLVRLDCSRTNVSILPNLPKLEVLYCHTTNVPSKELGLFDLYRINDLQLQIGCQIKYIKTWLEMSEEDIEDLDSQAKSFNDKYRTEVLEFIELTNNKICKEK